MKWWEKLLSAISYMVWIIGALLIFAKNDRVSVLTKQHGLAAVVGHVVGFFVLVPLNFFSSVVEALSWVHCFFSLIALSYLAIGVVRAAMGKPPILPANVLNKWLAQMGQLPAKTTDFSEL